MSQFEAFLIEREEKISQSQEILRQNDISFLIEEDDEIGSLDYSYHSSRFLNEKCHDYDPEKDIPAVQLKVDQEKRILRATRHEFSDSSPATLDQVKDEANFPRPVETIDLEKIYEHNLKFQDRRLRTFIAIYGSLWTRPSHYDDIHRYLLIDGTGCVEIIYRISKKRIQDATTKQDQIKNKDYPKKTSHTLKKANELILDHLTKPIKSGTCVTVMGNNLVRHPKGHLILNAGRIIPDPSGHQQKAFKALLLQSITSS